MSFDSGGNEYYVDLFDTDARNDALNPLLFREWVWSDGSKAPYLGFNETQPNTPTDRCVIMAEDVDYRSLDISCNSKRSFLCEQPISSKTYMACTHYYCPADIFVIYI